MPVRAAPRLPPAGPDDRPAQGLPDTVVRGADGREVVDLPGELGPLLDRLYVMNVKDALALTAEKAGYDAAVTVACEDTSP